MIRAEDGRAAICWFDDDDTHWCILWEVSGVGG